MNLTIDEFFSGGLLGKAYMNDPTGEHITTMMLLGAAVIIICAYLLGSINFAIIISGKKYNEDIRSYGSKNAGMTNMMRTYGKRAAAMTLLGDCLKAVVACLIGYLILGNLGSYLAGVFCILGHVFPVFYRFKGGKGVVTAFTTILMCDPFVCLIVLLIFVILVALTKFISLGSVMSMLLYPLILDRVTRIATLWSGNGERTSPYIIFAVIIAAIVFIKHWENIKRLVKGEENKFSFKKSVKPAEHTEKSDGGAE